MALLERDGGISPITDAAAAAYGGETGPLDPAGVARAILAIPPARSTATQRCWGVTPPAQADLAGAHMATTTNGTPSGGSATSS
jgi:hypothetical protein